MPQSDREHRIFSPLDLLPHNGEDKPEIYLSFLGTVYDVTSRPDLYGQSPPGPYHLFAGRECARALATMSLDPADVGRTDVDELSALTAKATGVLTPDEVREAVSRSMRDWQEKLALNYEMVGVMRPWLQGKAAEFIPPPRKLAGLQNAGSHPRADAAPGARAASASVPPGPLEVLCCKPRLHFQRHFLSPTDCQRLISMTLRRQEGNRFRKKVRAPLLVQDSFWSADEQAFLQSIEDRLAELTGGPVHEDETALVGTLTPAGGGGDEIAEHLGLHVDTNAAHWRYCTAIIYLSSVPSGGETVFPAAIADGLPSEDEERAVEAAGQLLDFGLDHTDRAMAGRSGAAKAAATDLLAAAAAGTGLKVKPEEGAVCIFWTRQDDGEIDRHSWHGGAPVPEGEAWKWTLQKFKEVPLSARQDPASLANFVRGSRCCGRKLACTPTA